MTAPDEDVFCEKPEVCVLEGALERNSVLTRSVLFTPALTFINNLHKKSLGLVLMKLESVFSAALLTA